MAPPYDVITPQMQETLYQQSQYNIIHIDLGKDQVGDDEYNNKYHRAASYLKEWKSNGTLIDDPAKNFYIYQQEFTLPDGTTHKRNGFFAAVLIEDPKKGKIHGHEHTFQGPKADRLKLMRSTHANISPIFCVYSDPEQESDALLKSVIEKEAPRTEVKNMDGVTHRLWLLSNPQKVKQLSSIMQARNFYIADGHHRYETCLQYCTERLQAEGRKNGNCPPYTYTLAYLANYDSEGVVILPTHRVLSAELGEGVDYAEVMSDLEEFFSIKPLTVDLKNTAAESARILAEMVKMGAKGTTFAMVFPSGKGAFLTLKDGVDIAPEMIQENPPEIAKLDVSILHDYLIPKVWVGNPEIELDDQDVFYVRDAAEALDKLKAPVKASATFLMNSPTIEQVREVASKNLRMPHKTTYFYPKLLTGLVVRDHSAPW